MKLKSVRCQALGILTFALASSGFGCSNESNVPSPPAAAAAPTPAQRIALDEQIVASDPKNLQAWIRLGNGYFDVHDPAKAIAAYGKALALEPKNPNVLTDQGVMYRELREFEKAIANFKKANAIDPKHLQSLYNLGVVYAYDKKDPNAGIKYWTRVTELAPNSQDAASARQAISEVKSSLAAKP